MKEINKIYYIIHPAYSVGTTPNPNNQKSPEEIHAYIKQTIIPIIKKAQHDPRSIVILLRSSFGPPTSEKEHVRFTFPEKVQDWSKQLQAYRIERNLRNTIKKLLKNRCVILRTKKGSDKEAIDFATKQLKTKITQQGIALNKNAEMWSYGSWWEVCASNFSEKAFEALKLKGRLRVPESGSIKFPKNIKMFKGQKERPKRIYTKHHLK